MRNNAMVKLTCNECEATTCITPATIANEEPEQAIMRIARTRGWYTHRNRDIDLCPDCLDDLVKKAYDVSNWMTE